MSESSNGPTHRVYTLIPRKVDGKDEPFWLNIGSAFAHKDGRGYNLVLEALPLDGRLVLRDVKEKDPDPEHEPKRSGRR